MIFLLKIAIKIAIMSAIGTDTKIDSEYFGKILGNMNTNGIIKITCRIKIRNTASHSCPVTSYSVMIV